jgi:ubiquinone/menaquinone biosynthesis C-methylase UbiE
VYANEVDEGDLEDIRERVEKEGLRQITVVAGTQGGTGLPTACCDAVLLRRVYHHFTDPQVMLRDLFRALRPGGRLAVVDFAPNSWSPPPGVPERGGHGVEAEEVIRGLTTAGFELVRQVEDWKGEGSDYCLLFAVPGPTPEPDS